MDKTSMTKVKLLLVGAYFSLIGVAYCQDRVWTNNEGRQISGRAVSKDETSVTLRIQDGKRVPVKLETLSPADLEWLSKWKIPVITASASMQGVGYQGTKRIEKRRFEFDSSENCSLVIFEDELTDVIAALKKLIVLAQKPADDVKLYEQVIHMGKAIGRPGESNIVIFRVVNGKPYCGGWIAGNYNSNIPLEKLIPLLDYLETFSVRDWDRKKEEIERRFKN